MIGFHHRCSWSTTSSECAFQEVGSEATVNVTAMASGDRDTSDDADGSDAAREAEIDRILDALNLQRPATSVLVGFLPEELGKYFGEAAAKPIRVPWSRRAHLDSHEWIRHNRGHMIRAVLDPDEIRLDRRKPHRKILLYRRALEMTLVAVVVEIKRGGSLSNTIVSAFDVRTHLEDRRNAEVLIWESEKEERN